MKEWIAGFKKFEKPPPQKASTVIDTEFDRWAAPVAARKLWRQMGLRKVTPDRGFYLWDKDRNGYLSVEELKAGVNSLFPKDTFTTGELNMALKYFDRNGDNKISRVEWNKGFEHLAAKFKEENE